MKHLGALCIWIGLMTSSQVSADEYVFKPDLNDFMAPSLQACSNAAQNGIELSDLKEGDTVIKRYLHQDKIYMLVVNRGLEEMDMILRCLFLKQSEIVQN